MPANIDAGTAGLARAAQQSTDFGLFNLLSIRRHNLVLTSEANFYHNLMFCASAICRIAARISSGALSRISRPLRRAIYAAWAERTMRLTGPIPADGKENFYSPAQPAPSLPRGGRPIRHKSTPAHHAPRIVPAHAPKAAKTAREKIIAGAGLRIAPIGGIEKLHQIIGADRQEIEIRQQFIQLPNQSRHFQHGAQFNLRRHFMAESRPAGRARQTARYGWHETRQSS